MMKMNSTADWQQSIGKQADLEMQTPTRPAGLVSDLLVPVGQAMITGFLIAGLITFLASRWGFKGELPPFFWGLTLAIWAGMWVYLLVDTRKLLRAIEKLKNIDLDGDGVIGQPEEGKRLLEVHVTDGKGRTRIVESEWLGIDDERLIAFAVGITNGRGLSEGEWRRNQAIFPDGINAFRAFRSKLQEAGLIALVNPNAPAQGYKVTPSGRAFFRRIAAEGQYEED